MDEIKVAPFKIVHRESGLTVRKYAAKFGRVDSLFESQFPSKYDDDPEDMDYVITADGLPAYIDYEPHEGGVPRRLDPAAWCIVPVGESDEEFP